MQEYTYEKTTINTCDISASLCHGNKNLHKLKNFRNLMKNTLFVKKLLLLLFFYFHSTVNYKLIILKNSNILNLTNILGFVENMCTAHKTNSDFFTFIALLNQNKLMKLLYNLVRDSSSYLQYEITFVLNFKFDFWCQFFQLLSHCTLIQ